MPNIALLSTSSVDVEQVSSIASLIENHGFMVIFATIVLILTVTFFFTYGKRVSKKSNAELDMLMKERNANIERNDKMFDLVTKVQAEQVVQLREMTDSLREINNKTLTNEKLIEDVNNNVEKLQDEFQGYGRNQQSIIKTLDEILLHVKMTETSNHEIIEKVKILETYLTSENEIDE